MTVLTLTPARRNNSRVTSSSEERGCSRVIARNIVVCPAFSEGLRPGRPGCSICAFLTIRYLAHACLDQSITREMLFSSTPSEAQPANARPAHDSRARFACAATCRGGSPLW